VLLRENRGSREPFNGGIPGIEALGSLLTVITRVYASLPGCTRVYASLPGCTSGCVTGVPRWVVYTSEKRGEHSAQRPPSLLRLFPFHCWRTVPASTLFPFHCWRTVPAPCPALITRFTVGLAFLPSPVSLLVGSSLSHHPFHCWSVLPSP